MRVEGCGQRQPESGPGQHVACRAEERNSSPVVVQAAYPIDLRLKWENLKAALALHFARYNFCRVHGSLRVTPAMESGDHGSGVGAFGAHLLARKMRHKGKKHKGKPQQKRKPPTIPAPPPQNWRIPSLKKLLYAGVTIVGTLAAVLALRPKLSISSEAELDPSDAFSAPFVCPTTAISPYRSA